MGWQRQEFPRAHNRRAVILADQIKYFLVASLSQACRNYDFQLFANRDKAAIKKPVKCGA
jgi:hypothetical protein